MSTPTPTTLSSTTLSTALLDAALAAAGRGWPVFPLAAGSKRPVLHSAARCRQVGGCAAGHLGWEQRATLNPDRIHRAWSAGRFNVGLACGPAGLVVIDLDTPHDEEAAPPEWARLDVTCGADVLAALADQARETVPPTRTVATPSGGRHLYFAAPAGIELRNTAGARGSGLGWLVDTRAVGGYVVAPGSITPTGTYRLLDDRDPAPLPAWLVQRLHPAPPPPAPAPPRITGHGRATAYIGAAIEAETARVIGAPAGQRNACLYIAAVALGQLVAGGALEETTARTALHAAADRHVALRAYSRAQAEKTITSGLTAGARRPRSIGDAA